MGLTYQSTRGRETGVPASMAILKGLAEDGGLFMPTEIPELDVPMEKLGTMTYQETAYEVMKLFLTDYSPEELKDCITKAYDSKFDTEEIAPLAKADGAYFLELYHGSTIAFKDMALSILPHLMTTAAKKNRVDKEIVVLTATSGDTGKAAMAGFADVPGTRIIVFYPKDGVSKVQELQMRTQKGANTNVVAINGNFDDAQTGVKKLFGDKSLEACWNQRASSSHPPIPSISADWSRRSFTMYMPMQGFWPMRRLQEASRLMWWFPQATSVISWQPTLQNAWAFRLRL